MANKPDSYKPISGNDLPRFAGIATFMRLPYVAPADADDVDIGLIGALGRRHHQPRRRAPRPAPDSRSVDDGA